MAKSEAEAAARAISRATALHYMLTQMTSLASDLGLKEQRSFEMLDDILRDAVENDRLLRSLFINFVKDGNEVVRFFATINWRTKRLGMNERVGGNQAGMDELDEIIDLDNNQDFETALRKRMKTFRSSLGQIAKLHTVDSADYSLILIDADGKKARSDIIRARYRIQPVSKDVAARSERFEDQLASTPPKSRNILTHDEMKVGGNIGLAALPLPSISPRRRSGR